MVSEASIPDRHDGWFSFGAFRRASTQSMGPVVVPVSTTSLIPLTIPLLNAHMAYAGFGLANWFRLPAATALQSLCFN